MKNENRGDREISNSLFLSVSVPLGESLAAPTNS